MRKKLYEYVVLRHDEQKGTKILVDGRWLAGSEEQVRALIYRKLDAVVENYFESLEVLIRPFC